MHNRPFRFLDSPTAVQQLRRVLEDIGLESGSESVASDEGADPYHPACWSLTCPWLTEPVELHWHFCWWPDGYSSELSRVSVTQQGTVVGEIDVEELLRRRPPRPLAQLIVERLAAICGQLSKR